MTSSFQQITLLFQLVSENVPKRHTYFNNNKIKHEIYVLLCFAETFLSAMFRPLEL